MYRIHHQNKHIKLSELKIKVLAITILSLCYSPGQIDKSTLLLFLYYYNPLLRNNADTIISK